VCVWECASLVVSKSEDASRGEREVLMLFQSAGALSLGGPALRHYWCAFKVFPGMQSDWPAKTVVLLARHLSAVVSSIADRIFASPAR
jgi:hypothetical protein